MCDVGAAGWPGVLAVLRRRHVYGGVLLMYHIDWSIKSRHRYITVMFRTQGEEKQWRPIIDVLVKIDAAEDAIGEVCALMYGGQAWLYHPPSGEIELYVPHIITEFDQCEKLYHWALHTGQQPVRRYDGTAQQAEEAMAAKPVR